MICGFPSYSCRASAALQWYDTHRSPQHIMRACAISSTAQVVKVERHPPHCHHCLFGPCTCHDYSNCERWVVQVATEAVVAYCQMQLLARCHSHGTISTVSTKRSQLSVFERKTIPSKENEHLVVIFTITIAVKCPIPDGTNGYYRQQRENTPIPAISNRLMKYVISLQGEHDVS